MKLSVKIKSLILILELSITIRLLLWSTQSFQTCIFICYRRKIVLFFFNYYWKLRLLVNFKLLSLVWSIGLAYLTGVQVTCGTARITAPARTTASRSHVTRRLAATASCTRSHNALSPANLISTSSVLPAHVALHWDITLRARHNYVPINKPPPPPLVSTRLATLSPSAT